MRKILMLGAFPSGKTGVTGAKIGTKYVYDLLRSNRFNVKYIDRSLLRNAPIDNKFIVVLHRFLNFFNSLFILVRLFIILIRFRPDYFYTVLASSKLGFARDLVVLACVKSFGVKVVTHVRNGNFVAIHGYNKFLLKYYYNFIDDIIFLDSSLLKEETYTCFKKIHIIANPIDAAVVPTYEEVISVTSNLKLEFIFVSNLILSKGYFDFLSAISKLQDEILNCSSFKFYGKFESEISRNKFHDFIEENKLSENVEYGGVIYDRELLKNTFLRADVIVLPTYYPNEAQPRCLIEAISSSCLVISTKHASIYSSFGDNSFISYVNKQDPDSIARAINNIHEDRKNLYHKKLTARQYYSSKFSSEVLDKKLLGVFS